ncbi:diguanylate cyclase [Gammaproteobacteria bacterium AB-CW1]|uniref:diguanylate cyclase n=1 Tax=Natronospira elongata TaxID=3110268 RepID=A0AAP6MJL7_9GAMM|nr:diguanylate cyclase [Gammaproteobacteria bacterium AB-CW1]
MRAIAISLTLLLLPCLALGSEPDPRAEKRFQDFVRDSWSLEAGLPQITVSAISQGPEGYIWVGTQQGLARFDGVRFRTWTPDQEPALHGSFINDLHLDSRGRLWIGTYKGLTLYQDRSFAPITGPLAADGRPREITIQAISEAPDGRILVGADEGLFVVDGDGLELAGPASRQPISALTRLDDRVYIGGLGTWRVLDEEGFGNRHDLPEGMSAARVTGFAHHAGGLWLGTSAGLLRHDQDGTVHFAPEGWDPGEPVDAIREDSHDNLWVGTNRALLRLRAGNLYERIDPDHPNAHRQIQSIYQDHEGSLWLGSFRDGLARYWPGWAERFNEPQGLHEPLIWSIADAGDGDVWVGTNDGLSLLRNGQYQLILPGQDLPHPHAYTLTMAEEGLWIGTRRGLVLMDPETRQTHRPDALAPLDAHQINGIVPAGRHGRYFIATSGGLWLWGDDEQLRRISERIGSTMVRQLKVEENGTLLVATQQGVYAGFPDNLVRLDHRHGLDPQTDYSAILRLDRDTVVFASIDSGLYVGRDGEWHHLNTADGLPTNAAYFLSHDDQGHLWVAGFHGLYRAPVDEIIAAAQGRGPERIGAEMILSESGHHIGSQQAYCCNGAGHAKGMLREDGLWLPTRGGAVRIRPEAIHRNPVPPPIRLERVRYGDQWHVHTADETLSLPIGRRDLNFEFTALSFQDPRSVRINYRLQGYDDDWRALESSLQRSAAYTNLPPGDYQFQVRAANNAGVWAEDYATLDFHVPPRFHETLWFQALPLVALLLLFLAGYRWRVRRLRRQQLQLQREVEQRTEELRVTNNRLVEANRALRDASQTDPLTGLRNRRYLYGQMTRDLAHFERLRDRLPEGDLVLVFALVDVDHFKQVNDEHGHRAGDLVLKQLGERLSALVRTGDYVVRWGGEEFLVVFREMARTHTERIIDRLQRNLVEQPYRIDEDKSSQVSVSIGYAEFPLRSESDSASLSWEAIVDLADYALYACKNHGRNGWAVVRPGSEKDPIEFLRTVRNDLEAAVEDGRASLSASWLKPLRPVQDDGKFKR